VPAETGIGFWQRRSVRQRVWLGCCYALLIVLSAGYLAPFAWQVSSSLKDLDAVYDMPPRWLAPPRWGNYARVFEVIPFGTYLINTALVTAAAVAGQVLSGALAAYAFARLRWRGREVCFVLLLSTLMLPRQVTMVPQYIIFKHLGWVDTYKPLVVPFFLGGGAFYIFLLRQYFLTIPRELEEAARIDGAGHWRIFWSGHLPQQFREVHGDRGPDGVQVGAGGPRQYADGGGDAGPGAGGGGVFHRPAGFRARPGAHRHRAVTPGGDAGRVWGRHKINGPLCPSGGARHPQMPGSGERTASEGAGSSSRIHGFGLAEAHRPC